MATTGSSQVAELLQMVLRDLASSDNVIRSKAEDTLNKDWILGQPNALFSSLVQIIQSSPDVHLRSFATILFRRIAFRMSPQINGGGDMMLWMNLNKEVVERAKHTLLTALTQELVVVVVHKLCDTIAEVARYVWTIDNDWPELFQCMAACLQSERSAQRAAVFRIFAAVPAVPVSQSVDAVKPILVQGLQDTDASVRLAALQAGVAYLMESDAQVAQQCQDLLPMMLSTLEPLVHSQDETQLVEAFSSLTELAEQYPKPFRPVMANLLTFCVQISGNTDLEDSTRQGALEMLLTLAESSASAVRKTPSFCETVVPTAMAMLAEMDEDEDDKTWYTVENLGNDDEEADSNSALGEQAMDRLARALGGKYMFQPSFQLIPQYLQSPNWPKRHAGLMAISAIGEGCGRTMEKELGNILQLVVPFFSDSHDRVRYAACNCIGQLSTDFPDTVQPRYHELVLSHLIPVLQNSNSPRVQAHAAAALVNFCEQATQATLQPYLDTLLTNLLTLLNSSLRYVQEQALTTIATVADSAEDKFVKYYPTIMPMLFNVMRQASQREYRMLRGKAMECATLIALAVGKETMGPQANELAEILRTVQTTVTESDDPQVSYLLAAWTRMCKVMEDDFAPYLPVVMPPLLRSAAIKPDFAVLDLDDDAEGQYSSEDGWEFVTYNGKQIGMRTSFMEEKCTAVEMLICYARELGARFQPYADEVLNIVVPLLRFHFHEGVKTAAAHALPQVLGSVYQHAQLVRQQDPAQAPASEQYVQNAWGIVCGKLVNAILDEADMFAVSELLNSFNDCMGVFRRGMTATSGPNPPALRVPADQMDKVINVTLSQCRAYCKRVQERQEENGGQEDYDPEDEFALSEDEANDEALLTEIGETIHHLFLSQGSDFLPYFDRLLPMVLSFLQDAQSSTSQQWAICVFDNMIEFTGPASWSYQQHFAQALVQGATSAHNEVRQAAIYGLGVTAQFGGPQYAELCAHVAPILVNLINAHDSKELKNVFVRDNAISALGKICRFNASQVDMANVLPFWYSVLPVTNDEEECPPMFEYLLELLEQCHPVVMGGPNLQTPAEPAATRLVQIFTDFFISGTKLEEPLNARVIQTFQACLGVSPADVKNKAMALLTEHDVQLGAN
ncbi:importin subunit beta-3 [Dispira simplex]|nr:importin subunit beta-3 [Dispira simplex]